MTELTVNHIWLSFNGMFKNSLKQYHKNKTEIIKYVCQCDNGSFVITRNLLTGLEKTGYRGYLPKSGSLRNGIVYSRKASSCFKRKWMFPTPTTNGVRGGSHSLNRARILIKSGILDLETAVLMGMITTGESRKIDCNFNATKKDVLLNPQWIEWLMGWPIDWTKIF